MREPLTPHLNQRTRSPSGYETIEGKLIWLEIHVGLLLEDAKSKDVEITQLKRDRAALIRQVGFWIIGGLLTALATIVYGFLSGDIPLPK